MILESWRRCSAMQVSPLLRNAPLAIIHEDQLRCLLEGSQLFLRAAHPAMKRFSDFLDAQVLWNLLETELLDLERLEKMELFAVSPEGK